MIKIKFILGYLKKMSRRLRYEWSLEKISRREGVIFEDNVEIRGIGNLSLGADTMIGSNTLLHCGGHDWSAGASGGIKIGAKSYVGPHSVLFGAGGIEIGDNVMLGPGVTLASHQHTDQDPESVMKDQPIEFGRIVIENDVWIGSRAVVLPNITIHSGSIIGAGAVVTKDIPPFSVAVGVPARVIRTRNTVGIAKW